MNDVVRQSDPKELRNVPSLALALGGRSSEADFVTALMQSSTDCVKYIELDGRLSVMNANGMCALHIDDFSSISGQHWASLWPQETAHLIHHAISEANQGQPARFEGFCPTAKGAPRWWDVTVAPVMGPDGRPTGIVSISRDVTASVESRKRIEEVATHNEMLVREVSHRIKNLFALVLGLIRMSARNHADVPSLIETITARVIALSRSHELTLQQFGDDSDFAFEDLVHAVLEPYRDQVDAIAVEGPPVRLSPEQGHATALALHEMATNAAKYGALSVAEGKIAITWRVENSAGGGRHLQFDWVESGGPAVDEPRNYGFGSRLIELMLAGVHGTVERRWPRDGVQLILRLPMSDAEIVLKEEQI